jgi:Arc/MetJ-type ribon-helix-helix transcriptional regulator
MENKGGKRVRWKTVVISGRVSPKTYQAVLDVVDSGSYVDVTDYLRDLIRNDLDARGITLAK